MFIAAIMFIFSRLLKYEYFQPKNIVGNFYKQKRVFTKLHSVLFKIRLLRFVRKSDAIYKIMRNEN